MDKKKEEPFVLQFFYDASIEILEANYKKAISILKLGIENTLSNNETRASKNNLLFGISLLITSVEKTFKQNNDFGLRNPEEIKTNEDICGFCSLGKSKVKILVVGAHANICNSCLKSIYKDLKK